MKQIQLYIIYIISTIILSAQPNVPKAPSAESMNYQQYASSNTNYFDGSENINVPIASVSEGPLSHSVSLTYNTRGIQVGSIASQVGLGWSLNAGGMITRTIRGISDGSSSGYGYYEMVDKGHSITDEQAANGERDREPDLYRFSVGNFSGTFFLDENNWFHVTPHSNIKIEILWDPIPSQYDYDFPGFKLTDEYGTNYYFGKQDADHDYLEYYAPDDELETRNCNSDRNDITGWFLYKIESYDMNHAIEFEYEKVGYKTLSIAEQSRLFYDVIGGNGSGDFDHEYLGNEGDFDNVFNKGAVKSWIIKEILTTNTTLDFINKSEENGPSYKRLDLEDVEEKICTVPFSVVDLYPKYLDKIKIDYTSHCRNFEFNYDYFDHFADNDHGWSYPPWTEKRLKLEGVQKLSCNGNLSEPEMTFDYYGGSSFPNYLNTGLDHWGFYNGQNLDDFNLIPEYTQTTVGNDQFMYGSADRNPSHSHTLNGVLQKITYPTGGHIEYTYELNTRSVPTPQSYIFERYMCNPGGCCTPVAYNHYVTIDQNTFDNAILEFYLFPMGLGVCSDPNSIQGVRVFDSNNVEIKEYSINSTGPLVEDEVSISVLLNNLIVIGQTYRFEVFGENLWEESYVRLTNVNAFNEEDVGGLRILTKKVHDGFYTSNDMTLTYDYGFQDQLLHRFPSYVYGAQFGAYNNAHFYYDPSFPLQNYFGSHVTYAEVTVHNNANDGKTVYKFDSPFNFSNNDFPPVPSSYDNKNGFLKESIIEQESGTPLIVSQENNVQKNDIIQFVITPIKSKKIKVKKFPMYTNVEYLTNTYSINSGITRVESNTKITDGFETTIDYTYFGGTNQFQPQTVTVINSDGKEHKSVFNYTDNYTWGFGSPTSQNGNHCLKHEFLRKNIRNIKWKTQNEVNSTILTGSATEYKLFNDSDGLQATSCNLTNNDGKSLRAFRFLNIERTWDESGQLSPFQWVEYKRSESYTTDGLLKIQSKPFWSINTEYTYDKKRVINVNNGSQISTFEYYFDSNLLKKKTDVQGISTTYLYDELFRLKRITEDCNGVFTEYGYNFTNGGSNPDNKITTTTDFTAPCNGVCDIFEEECAVNTLTSIDYLDGLGRKVQSVGLNMEPGLGNDGDIIHAVEYGNQGKVVKSYLPFLTSYSNNGAFVTPQNSWGYSESSFANSPTARAETSTPPGGLLTTHQKYESNTSTDNIINHHTGNPYPPGTLKKNFTIDARNIQHTTFTDKVGNLICKRTNKLNISTIDDEVYYLYDDKNRLAKVIPFGGSSTDQDLIYEYVYYKDDKIHLKKIPGAEEKEYVYNARGLLSFVQDGNLRNTNEWLVSNYDDYGRMSETAKIMTTSAPPNESFFYTVIPPEDMLTENIYDATTHNLDETRTKILGTSDFLEAKYFYDSCNRMYKTESNTHLELNDPNALTTEFIFNQLSEVRSKESTLVNNGSTHSFKEKYLYDDDGRERFYYGDLDINGSYEIVRRLDFNEREELITKTLGVTLQQLNYGYTDWGALKSINSGLHGAESQLNGFINFTPSSNLQHRDLFYLELFYNDVFDADGDGNSDNVLYGDGSISAVKWQTRGRREMAYTYEYDNLYQLTEANFYEQNASSTDDYFNESKYYSTSYNYSDRGLINEIVRNIPTFYNNQNPIRVKSWDFTYDLNSNQLTNSILAEPDIAQFYDNYTYDDNGNMINGHLDQFAFNYLNLPINKEDNNVVIHNYEYDASGNMNSQVYSDPNSSTTIETDYIGNFEFIDGSLEKVHFEEGFLSIDYGSASTNYFITDHLGNVRIVFSDINEDNKIEDVSEVLQENHYYPFGLKFGYPGGSNLSWLGSSSSNDLGYNGMNSSPSNSSPGHLFNKNNYNTTTYRTLDMETGMWLQVDPKAEAVKSMSPYCSMGNNPISNADPDGDLWFVPLIGAASGIFSNGLSNLSQGASFFDGAAEAGFFGGFSAS